MPCYCFDYIQIVLVSVHIRVHSKKNIFRICVTLSVLFAFVCLKTRHHNISLRYIEHLWMRGYIYVILLFQYPGCIEKFSSVIKPKIAQFAFAKWWKGNEFNVSHQKIKFSNWVLCHFQSCWNELSSSLSHENTKIRKNNHNIWLTPSSTWNRRVYEGNSLYRRIISIYITELSWVRVMSMGCASLT